MGNIGFISKINKMLVSKKISCVELTKKYIEEINKSNLNAYITVTEEIALKTAKKVDEKISKNEKINLIEGVPTSIKDMISVKDVRNTCGSKMLENYYPIYSASCWEFLEKEGAVLLGKSNQDEFAMGSSNETSYYGPVLNPYDNSRVPGGSSGGGAASVAGGLAVYALGTDTGGSIRQPASFCGIVGFKPSYGSVSRYGVIPMASSFDQVGPLSLTVEDASIIYDCISRFDPKDSTSSPHKRDLTYSNLNNDLSGLKIGIPEECMEGIDNEIVEKIKDSIKIYESLGVKVEYFSLPEIKYAMPIYYILMCVEASSNLGRFDGIRYGFKPEKYDSIDELIIKSRTEGFGMEVKRRIILGNYVLSSKIYNNFYEKAQKLREFLTYSFINIFKNFDIIMYPTTPTTAFKFNYAQDDPVKMYLADLCTVTANEIRMPSISIPCGFDSLGLPIGIQLMAPRFKESLLLNVAYKHEKENFCTKIVSGVDLFKICF